MSDSSPDEIRAAFADAVNMTPKDLEEWLETEDSKSVGQKDGGGEATGHEMGRHIVELKRKKKADLTETDLERMEKVAGYVARHLEQGGPNHDKVHSRWRWSLMNWGHDPLK